MVSAEETAASPPTLADALARLALAEDTLRAIGAGEVDAFVVDDGTHDTMLFSLSTADRPYRLFVESMRDGAATLSSSGIILYANDRLAEMLACTRQSIVGSALADHLAGDLPAAVTRPQAGVWPRAVVEATLLDERGVHVPVLIGSAPLDLERDGLTCLTFTDLTAQKAQDREIARLSVAQELRMAELQAAHEALTVQATHDALTGLPNRGLLVDRIDQALAQARRSGVCTAVYFVDLDGFKRVNDTMGHAAGDLVLQSVARRLSAALRPGDTVARIGGDEFVVLTPGLAGPERATTVSDRLMVELARMSDESPQPIAASIGVSTSVAGRDDAEVLLHEADRAMYEAKSLGGTRVALFDPAFTLLTDQRTDTQGMIEAALDDGRLIAHYQPIIDLPGGAVAGYEALARIRTVGGDILPPSAFIDVAESSGQITPLGAQMLHLACVEADRWGALVPGPGPIVAVNLSGRQFEGGSMHTVVAEALAASGLPPSRLHLELTETAIIDLHPDNLIQLEAIAEMGVQIGLDDFGTGYASLSHLRRLPLSFVKIDQSFVQGIGLSREDEQIVLAVVDLAANLEMRSIAEGVQTPRQLERLTEMGCDQAQGYLIARPMPAGDLPRPPTHRAGIAT
ncbi:MAG: EAL domain-containing protein [Nitriliruptoraceae bacterium]|nr:EAL domain-containing protein [Nitriliruptoraceae bacterium]